MKATFDTTLADIVNTSAACARVLESFGLDYCCGGQRSLAEATAGTDVDPGEVVAALADVDVAAEPAPEWVHFRPRDLVDHLEATHHAYLHRELPRLQALADKVAAVHGARHPELSWVRERFEALRVDLEPHLQKEERVLFPLIRDLSSGRPAPMPVSAPISVMMHEHDTAGDLLAELRRLTGGYEAPADGCASYRALYEGLAELEADTHTHVHKENNVLFPAVLDLEVVGSPQTAIPMPQTAR
jgi:regulator of cell morphogenesis and NO signaling